MPHSEKAFNTLYNIVSYKPDLLRLEYIKNYNLLLKKIGNDIGYEIL
ncbi:MAG: hypothetical protein RLZZ546_173 [Bacteroidota bacterium]|jgi:hypothetical protein